jgi:uncharacterized protein (DUF697 family)/tellurite resistance protein
MTKPVPQPIATITLLAAFADGAKSESEREAVKRIVESLTTEQVNLAGAYQDVLLKRVTLDDAVAALDSRDSRQLAYEMAVCVADADGVQNDAEKRFLAALRDKLGLDPGEAQAFSARADAVAAAPLEAPTAAEPRYAATVTEAQTDSMILNYAILNGALELLPESLASMAIIPLQMKMVYRIGKAHGFELDRGHIKDFLATLGVGLTSQYIEQVGVKLVGRLLGGMLGGIGKQAVSSGFSFAGTYALGHVAKRYYSGGRTLSGASLKEAFSGMLGEAKDLQARYLPEMQQKARTLDVAKVLREVSGKA